MKRKREQVCSGARKQPRIDPGAQQSQFSIRSQYPVLGVYYANICTLGEVLRNWLPTTSRARRKLDRFHIDFPQHPGFLTQIVVGFHAKLSLGKQQARRNELVAFTQTQRVARGDSYEQRPCDLSEILDFTIWKLFQQDAASVITPSHLLCHGFQRVGSLDTSLEVDLPLQLPGILERNKNVNIQTFKRPPWTDIANLLGRDAENIMLYLLLDCALFQQLQSGTNNLYQLSGKPVSRETPHLTAEAASKSSKQSNGPSSITFARHRMLHAKPSVNSKGDVQLGLKQVHVLNRYAEPADASQDLRVMQYVFPRQFGLHNIFDEKQNSDATRSPARDYTLREQEIDSLDPRKMSKTPRRMRGPALVLIHKLRENHYRCSYTQLIRHYCPAVSSCDQQLAFVSSSLPSATLTSESFLTQYISCSAGPTKYNLPKPSYTTSFMPYATPACQVSAFCQAIILRLVPRNTFGQGLEGKQNWARILSSIEQFVEIRRFESITLEEICKGLKIRCIHWLCPPSIRSKNKMSASDKAKRLAIFYELVYYMFDSLLVPLIRSNFYVTETGAHRNRLFYFRHDVWKKLAEPSLALMTLSMYEPLSSRQLKHHYSSHALRSGQMRLLPKEHGARPIMNLKRKVTRIINGRTLPGSSINSKLTPIFSILNLEKHRQPDRLASAMFSVSEIYDKLKTFKAKLNSCQSQLYFVKVDIRSCFDTIPQRLLFSLLDTFILDSEYRITTHVEMKNASTGNNRKSGQPVRKYVQRAVPGGTNPSFSTPIAAELAANRHQHVFVGTEKNRSLKHLQIQELLKDHLQENVVRIGHKYFKQTEGIPQGSVLSSLLCNLFYGNFEIQELGFLNPNHSLLLRLIDDFLLITTNEAQARQFVHVMSCGNAKYGISVNTEKSLVNFEVTVNGHKIPRLHGPDEFPYCGMMIDTRNLQVRKSRKPKDIYVGNGLSVVRSGGVGAMLQSKILSSLKRQMHLMLLDGSLNTKSRVMSSISECFVESGMKLHRYLRSLPNFKRPDPAWQIALVHQLIVIGNRMLHRAQEHGAALVTRSQVSWLASAALFKVFIRKQAGYDMLLHWLSNLQEKASRTMNMPKRELEDLMQDTMKGFVEYVY